MNKNQSSKTIRIPLTVWILGVISFFTDLSSEMIYPLLPVFLSSVLGATALEIGFIEGVAEATAALFKVASGVWTDRSPRKKPLILFGYSLSGLLRPLVGLAGSWLTVLGIRFVDRIGKGIRSAPRDALIAQVSHPSQRGMAYGIHRSMDHAGAVVGPLIASTLLLVPGMNLRKVFLIAGLPSIITILIIVFGIREKSVSSLLKTRNQLSLLRDWGRLGGHFKLLLLAVIVFTLGNSTDAFLLVRMSEAGVSARWIAALWSLQHIVKMVSTIYGGKLSDRWGRKAMILVGWIYYGVIYLAFAFIKNPTALVIVFLLYGAYYGCVEPSERALVADSVPEKLRGTAFGYYHFTVGLGALPASILFGYFWHQWGVESAFLMGGALAIAASFILAFSPRKALQ